jgi:lipopolysaccharide/colanic/teichoic acid biosynthesis glycosyltransferase
MRFFDILFALIAVILLAPMLIAIILLLSVTGERKIFYKQIRIGFNKKPFNLYKFATMLENSPNLPGGNITAKYDPRVLPVGRFLRKTKLNELPQLINIMKGDLGLIGPRPVTPDHFEMYDTAAQEIISSVRPGLSGIGSIIFRSEEDFMPQNPNERAKFYEQHISLYKAELEIWYVNNQSVLLDFRLITCTVLAVFKVKKLLIALLPKSFPKSESFEL